MKKVERRTATKGKMEEAEMEDFEKRKKEESRIKKMGSREN